MLIKKIIFYSSYFYNYITEYERFKAKVFPLQRHFWDAKKDKYFPQNDKFEFNDEVFT